MICVIHAHPYLGRSRTNRALADAIRALPGLDLRSLYDLYPDFDIDVFAEQQALPRARGRWRTGSGGTTWRRWTR